MATQNGAGTASGYSRRRGSIVGPVILILIGVLFLGQNFGWFPSSIWSTLLSYWPVLIILIGLELVLGRGHWVGALVLALVVACVVGLLSVVGTLPWTFNLNSASIASFTPVETIKMAEEMGQTKQATYQLEFGAGSLNVSALASGSTNLVDATLERDARATIDHSVSRDGTTTRVSVRGRNVDTVQVGNSGRTRMAFQLSPKTPSEVRVNGGAGDLTIDLSGLQVTYFELNAGVGGSKITLPQSAGRMSAQVKVGVGGVDVTVPEGVAAQIKVDKGLGGVDVDTSRFTKVGSDTYRSANYDSATNRVDLYISGGVGGISVK